MSVNRKYLIQSYIPNEKTSQKDLTWKQRRFIPHSILILNDSKSQQLDID